MNFQREDLRSIFKDGFDLFSEHHREVSHFKDKLLDLNAGMYYKVEEVGRLRVFTARTDEGELVGYSVFFVQDSIHHQEILQARQDAVYVKEEHRGFGLDFMDWCEKALHKEGVNAIYIYATTKNALGKCLERRGYEKVEELYLRRL